MDEVRAHKKRKIRFQVGDKVQICPDYWGKHLAHPYCDNGPDFIYTVAKANKTSLYFEGLPNDTWSNPSEHLMPAFGMPPEDDGNINMTMCPL